MTEIDKKKLLRFCSEIIAKVESIEVYISNINQPHTQSELEEEDNYPLSPSESTYEDHIEKED